MKKKHVIAVGLIITTVTMLYNMQPTRYDKIFYDGADFNTVKATCEAKGWEYRELVSGYGQNPPAPSTRYMVWIEKSYILENGCHYIYFNVDVPTQRISHVEIEWFAYCL